MIPCRCPYKRLSSLCRMAQLTTRGDKLNRNNMRFTYRCTMFGLFVMLTPLASLADSINWVGYQFGPPGGLGINPFGNASYFHGDNWLNYWYAGQSPGSDGDPSNDIAIFDDQFDPQGNGMPYHIYFGDFTVPAYPIFNPEADPIPGGDAIVNQLIVRNGHFTLNFTNEFGTTQGSLTTQAQLRIGDVNGTNGGITIHGGRLTTGYVAHIASNDFTKGVVEVNGAGAQWIHKSYVDLGLGGDGRITIKNGGYMEVQGGGSVIASIKDNTTGELEVLSNSQFVSDGPLFIGRGHQATGHAHGMLTVSGAGSQLKASNLQLGGNGGRGTAAISQGGSVEIAQAVTIYSNSLQASSLRIADAGSTLMTDGDLSTGTNGKDANVLVENSAIAEFRNVFINRTDEPNSGTSSMAVRSAGRLRVAESLTLFGQHGPSLLDASQQGRVEIGDVSIAASAGEIRIGAGGGLTGNGTVKGSVVLESGGDFSPGFSPGTIDILGDLALLPGSSLTLEIAGITPGLFDQINVAGTFKPAGELVVRFLNGYVPPPDLVSLPLFTTFGLGDTGFDNVRFENIDPLLIPPSWMDGSFAVATVPEPPAILTMLGCFVLVLANRSVRKCNTSQEA